MQMYIGNATNHILNFIYRIPGQTRSRTLEIPIGSQVNLPDDLKTDEVDAIIKHHSIYGLASANEVASVKDYTGTIFSLGKPIPAMRIEELMLMNRDQLIDLGKQIREDACIASHNIAEDAVGTISQGGGPDAPLRKMQVEIIEQNPDPRNEVQVSEGFRIDRTAPQQQAKQQGGRRRRGA